MTKPTANDMHESEAGGLTLTRTGKNILRISKQHRRQTFSADMYLFDLHTILELRKLSREAAEPKTRVITLRKWLQRLKTIVSVLWT